MPRTVNDLPVYACPHCKSDRKTIGYWNQIYSSLTSWLFHDRTSLVYPSIIPPLVLGLVSQWQMVDSTSIYRSYYDPLPPANEIHHSQPYPWMNTTASCHWCCCPLSMFAPSALNNVWTTIIRRTSPYGRHQRPIQWRFRIVDTRWEFDPKSFGPPRNDRRMRTDRRPYQSTRSVSPVGDVPLFWLVHPQHLMLSLLLVLVLVCRPASPPEQPPGCSNVWPPVLLRPIRVHHLLIPPCYWCWEHSLPWLTTRLYLTWWFLFLV